MSRPLPVWLRIVESDASTLCFFSQHPWPHASTPKSHGPLPQIARLLSPPPRLPYRYVEERFPQLLMHCAKVTGALLSDERIFKEYLVPFRRPLPSSILHSSTTHTPHLSAAMQSTDVALPPDAATSATLPPTVSVTPGPEAGAGAVPRGVHSAATSPSTADDSKDAVDRPSAFASPTFSSVSGASPASPLSPLPPSPPGLPPEGSDEATNKGRPGAIGGGASKQVEAIGNGGPLEAREDKGAESTAAAAAGMGSEAGPVPARSAKITTIAGVTGRVTEQNGPRGEGALTDVLLWNESAVAKSVGCRWDLPLEIRIQIVVTAREERLSCIKNHIVIPGKVINWMNRWTNVSSRDEFCSPRPSLSSKNVSLIHTAEGTAPSRREMHENTPCRLTNLNRARALPVVVCAAK